MSVRLCRLSINSFIDMNSPHIRYLFKTARKPIMSDHLPNFFRVGFQKNHKNIVVLFFLNLQLPCLGALKGFYQPLAAWS